MSGCQTPGGSPARRLRRLCAHAALSQVATAGIRDELVPAAADIELSDEEMVDLRRKYDEERDKRLDANPEGNAQYDRVADLARDDRRFARMLEDPYPKIKSRPLLTDTVEVCIVGAGYGGLCTGARCVQAGIASSDIRVIDKAGDVGGTWYWNRYPGAMCDTESYVYMPLCEDTGYVPTEKYAHQPEIYAHCQMVAKKFGLYENACFGAQVTRMAWESDGGMWLIHTDRGDAFRARYAVVNFGVLTDAKLPGIPGVGSFEGHMFHTSRWDYDYTGGSSSGSLNRLRDKRVAIVGTGATAVQVTPHLGEASGQLFVFQRTPSSVDIRNNRPTSPEFAQEHLSKPGWQAERQENFYSMTMSQKGAPVDLVNDGWTDILRNISIKTVGVMRDAQAKAKEGGRPLAELVKEVKRASNLAQFQQMEKVRRRAEIVVEDRSTAEALKPWYNQLCKRPCFHDDYLATFNRPNVTLVHTDGRGIDRVSAKGVVVNGVEYEVDCIVMATGFEVGGIFQHGRPSSFSFDIVGRGGVTLRDKWNSKEHRYGAAPKTYRSHHSSGFPNLFMLNGPQGAFTTNFTYTLDESSKHFSHIIARMHAEGYKTFDVKKAAEEEYLDRIWKVSPVSTGRKPACTPGYYNNEGRVPPAGSRTLGSAYPGAPIKLFKACEEERRTGTALDIFDLTR